MSLNFTNSLLMVRPARFALNEQTAVDNFYQQTDALVESEQAQAKALAEFDNFVGKLKAEGVDVHVIQDSEDPHTPDSIFPNNWISMHRDGSILLYPMKAENRRLERRPNIASELEEMGFAIEEIVDFSAAEEEGYYLEGTGALIFDHDKKLVYMARSQRADEGLLDIVASEIGYTPVVFSAFQDTPEGRQPIYHTNVMMCVTHTSVIICLDTIDDAQEKDMVKKAIEDSGKELIEISEAQKHQFAGNMLAVKGDGAKPLLVMSSRAAESLTQNQKDIIEVHHKIVHSDLETIENLGGGSARCMLAEIYLPKTNE